MARLTGYTRRSTDAQVASPQTQEDAIREWCRQNGHDLIHVYHEVAITGATRVERRIALPELVALVKSKRRDFDGVIVWKTDRLMRNPREQEHLLDLFDRYDCDFISIMDPVNRDTAAGRFSARVFGAANAYEREVTGERIFSHHHSAFKRGEWTGGPRSLGLTWIRKTPSEPGHFVANERAADIPGIYDLYIKLNGNASEAARELNRLGVQPHHNQFWSVQTVLSTLRNPGYRRQISFSGMRQDAPEIIPEIVDQSLIAQVDKLLVSASRRGFNRPSQVPAQASAYSGILTCSECGAGMVLNGHANPNDKQWYAGYTCGHRRHHGRAVCDSYQVSVRYVDTLMGHALARMLRGVQAEITTAAKSQKPSKRTTNNGSLSRAEEARRRTVDIYTRGLITDTDFEERLRRLDAEIAALQAQPALAPIALPESIAGTLSQLEDIWKDIPGEEKRGLLLQLGVRGALSTGGGRDIWLDVESDITAQRIRASGNTRSRWGVKCVKCCAL